ncbi:hypothetical protein Tco_0255458 [Tanacetum coccineum]
MRQGWDPRYKIWVEHGEPAPPTPPPVIDNTRQPLMSDMTALLNDLSYIPPNNEHNEPTQGDIGETSNEPTQATRNEFEELYASANEELYPGCDYVTRLDFMAKFTYFKAKGRLTDSIFNEMLEFFQNVFPISKGFKLPPSYYAIKKTFKTIGLGYESIHACEHDCCLFRGDNNKDLDFCPVCNTSRWKDSNTPGKKVPKKVLRYFPIIPRLQRLYKSSHTAKDMIWHATGKCTERKAALIHRCGTLLTSGRTWIPPAGHRIYEGSTCTLAKSLQYNRLLSRPSIRSRHPTTPGLTMWRRESADVLRRWDPHRLLDYRWGCVSRQGFPSTIPTTFRWGKFFPQRQSLGKAPNVAGENPFVVVLTQECA